MCLRHEEEYEGPLDPGSEGERVLVNADGEVILVERSTHGVTRSHLVGVKEGEGESIELK